MRMVMQACGIAGGVYRTYEGWAVKRLKREESENLWCG